ncbi:hypothetical protein BLX87_23055 [Bacillus sp. VT-16-64]|uniref:RusA family crossover junction endodeoxyribonuclease n=1 Tax=Siminovitchia sp. FSL W7-1587 TaxID=2954699 RepID=UPI00097D94CA|nr:hypothetical protein BLX87_23055 [Bacillus sp. VT-16-64]
MIEFTIPGEPVAQGRPRASTRNGKVRMYDPAKSKNYKTFVQLVARQHAPKKPLEGAVSMTVKIYRPMLKGFSMKRRNEAEAGLYRPITKPDNSNYLKGIEDALNGVIYHDDSQIVTSKVEKYYSYNPRVEIRVEEVIP